MNNTRVIKRMIYVSLLFTLLMIAGRAVYTRQSYGLFLVWNLFLAWIPFAISIVLFEKSNVKKWVQYLLFGMWLLFFPNAPYIITDFFHLQQRSPVPYWYDLLTMFWAAWNGLLMGFISLLYIEHFLRTKFSVKVVEKMVYFCIILCSFGVYAGRYLRWNSWDVIANPGDILSDVKYIALNPEDNLRTWGVTFFFSLLMITSYLTLKNLKKILP